MTKLLVEVTRVMVEVTRVVVTSGPGECGEEEGEPPVITNWFKTLMVPIGEPAALDCKIKVHIKRVLFEFIYLSIFNKDFCSEIRHRMEAGRRAGAVHQRPGPARRVQREPGDPPSGVGPHGSVHLYSK